MAKCSECGFLCVRKWDTRELAEAEHDYRKRADVPSQGEFNIYEQRPLCFALVCDLHDECDSESGNSEQAKALRVISRERDCDRFTQWHHGFTAKEHQQMLDQQSLLKWQRECQESDRQWREQQAERDRQWRKEDRQSLFFGLVVSFTVGVIGALAVLIAGD